MLAPLKGRRWPEPSWRRRYRMLVRENGAFTQANFTDRLAVLYDSRPVLFLDKPLEYRFLHGDEVTYRDLGRVVNRAGNALLRLGVRRGDRVALVTRNRVEIAFVEFGAQKIGAIPVPLNYMLMADEIRYLVEDSGCRVLVTDRTVFESNIGRRDRVPSVEQWIMATSRDVPEGFHSLGALMAEAPEALDPVEIGPDDHVLIFYTGGTTGFPKGAMLTNGGLMFTVRRYARLFGLLPRLPRQLSLLVMPLAHTGGHQALLLHIAMGTPALFMGRFDGAAVLDAIETHGVTLFSGTPAMYRMLEAAGAGGRDLRSIRIWGGGGDAFPDDLISRFRDVAARKVFGVTRRPWFVRGYGLAETCGQVAVARGGPMGEGCIGRVVKGLAHRVVDGQGGDVRPGRVGELVLRGPTVMVGYWGAPELTREVTRDGWFHTGDLVRRGPGGRLYMVAREKEVIKCGGYSVFPAEVEREIEGHPAVRRSAVVGLPHELKGEMPVAAVELGPGAAATAEDILSWARAHIAAYRCPRQVVIVDAIPVTFALKPRRGQVREQLLHMGLKIEPRVGPSPSRSIIRERERD
jgi:acyl-CoA synthetase (AMP-forming)/AMP-acid ligase II